MLEEELKNRLAGILFPNFDCGEIVKDIDFAVKAPDGSYLLWAEAKPKPTDSSVMLTQLVLTIGKARTFDDKFPPPFLGCFDSKKIAFVPYADIQHIFYQTDFNWRVAPSDTQTREFMLVKNQVQSILDISDQQYVFDIKKDADELRQFIRANFVVGSSSTARIKIDKNNFIIIYNKWLESVKPTIHMENRELAAKDNILDCDFYLADLLSVENKTLKEKLVLLQANQYKFNKKRSHIGIFSFMETGFSDNHKAHKLFWAKYERPPLEMYWDYIVERRNLLVPQDIRERKGSFYTPRIWVELSQKYIAGVLGDDWQDEYTVWDCAAGTGNLLVGLTNKYNIWASTLDQADVDVIHERIDAMNAKSINNDGANLLHSHVFQFDFLNDDFSQLPEGLRDIIVDVEKRKKLLIYINPPYVEGDARIGKGRRNVQVSRIHDKYQDQLGRASSELFAQFFIRIYMELHGVFLAEFSTTKILQAPNFKAFRNIFLSKLNKLFLVPADTFDNVRGQFPIGFFIWNTSLKDKFNRIAADVYNENGCYWGKKTIFSYDHSKYISDWLEENSKHISENHIGHLASVGNDFQHQNTLFINDVARKRTAGGRHTMISAENLFVVSVYFAVRKTITDNWLNDRDQFLYPSAGWEDDREFQCDCLVYAIFNNNIQSIHGENHWIPFTEKEINARDKFKSHFMTDFMAGKMPQFGQPQAASARELFPVAQERSGIALVFSNEARVVLEAGMALWRYYHAQPKCNVNASLYDIREHFQGRDANGRMNNRSSDDKYTDLIANLRTALKTLAAKIEPRVFAYGFLKE